MTENFFQDCYVRLRLMLDERHPLDGVLGLPAFFTLILLVFMAVNSHEDSSREHLNQLERKTQNLLDQGLFAEARLSAMRVMQNGEQNSKAILMEAKALRGMGRDQDSLRLLSRIAPIERPGYAAAHVGQATILLAQKPPAFAAAQEHVRHALQSDPSDQDALELAARFAAGQRRWQDTLAHLDKMALEKRPDLLLMKATALQFSGHEEAAVKIAKQAEQALRAMSKEAIGNGSEVRFSIAVSLSLQRRFEAAVDWILSSMQGQPTKEERQFIGGLYLSWSRHLRDQPSYDRMVVLRLLEQGIQICPESQDLIMAFLGDCESLTSSPADRQRYVEQILGNGGTANSFLHYYMGVQDWKQGNRESAKSHFELASTLNPGFKVIGNNLAMAMAAVSTDPAELEKALAIINDLIRQEPANPFFLDTRGHVYAKMGKFKEAVTDIERALPNARDKSAAHVLLADLYEHLGMTDLAAKHRAASFTQTPTVGGKKTAAIR